MLLKALIFYRLIHRWRALAVLGLVALCFGCSKANSGQASQRQARPVPVRVGKVVSKDMPVEVRAIGNVVAYAVVSVVPQVDGQITKVHIREGDRVKQGQLLFSIDARPYDAALRQARARLQQNEVQRANAKAEFERYTELVEKGYVSREQFEQKRTTAEAMAAAVAADKSAIDQALLNLQYTTIRSPIDGRAGSLLVDRGNVVRANDKPLVVLRQVQPVYVRFSVPEQYLSAIRERMAAGSLPVEAMPKDYQGKPAVGELTFLDNTVDTATGTIELKAQFANDDELLWPGQYVDVVLRLRTEQGATVVPQSAIQQARDGSYAFVIGPGPAAVLRKVEIKRQIGEEVVIESGLRPGEVVVTDGQLQLTDGAKVEIQNEAATAQHGSGAAVVPAASGSAAP